MKRVENLLKANEDVTDWMAGAWFQKFLEHSPMMKNKTEDEKKHFKHKIFTNLVQLEQVLQKEEN